MTVVSTEDRINAAVARYAEGWTCSQAVLSAFCGDFGLDADIAKNMACGFSGGMRRGDTCGVVTAGVMVLGLWSSKLQVTEAEQKRRCFDAVTMFIDRFEHNRKSAHCRDIIGYDVRDEKARKNSPGQQGRVCGHVVSDGVRLLADILSGG